MWPKYKIGEIATVNYGYTAKASFDADGPKFLRITDIQDGAVNWEDVPSCPISEKDHARHKLFSGDIVFARTGATTGKSFLIGDLPEAVAASYLIRLRIKREDVLPAFIAKCFHTKTYWDEVNAGMSGSAQGGFNASKLSDLKVSLPPLDEQKRIVAILDQAFEGIDKAIANTEKNLKNAHELFDSYLNNIFTQKGEGWVEDKLINITSKIGSGATPKGGAASYKDSGISLIRSLNVHDRRFRQEKLALIDNEQAKKLNNVTVQSGDVLFNITGASVARCCIVPEAFLPARVNQHVSILRPRAGDISTSFLCYLMTSRPYKDQLLGIGEEGGSTRQAITKAQLQELSVSFPQCLDQQKDIVKSLAETEAMALSLETLQREKIGALKELKQSLLQKAFSGELTGATAQEAMRVA